MGLQSETVLATEPVAAAEPGVSSVLILGADDSEGARDAAALAKILAPLLGAEVVPVHASGRGSPARQLYEEASARHAEIVVVGSNHRGEPDHTAPGKVLRGLLHAGPSPIAVAPRGYAEHAVGPPRVIGVAFDNSPEAHHALGFAARLATTASAALRVITVYTGGAAVEEPQPGVVTQRALMQEALHRTVADLPSELRAEPRFLTGAVAHVLAEQSELGVDLMVMGSRAYGPIRSFWLGSVSEELIRLSPQPLVIAPRGLLNGSANGPPEGEVAAVVGRYRGEGKIDSVRPARSSSSRSA
jgi:nucleotide-binding universal stress UspA family protein